MQEFLTRFPLRLDDPPLMAGAHVVSPYALPMSRPIEIEQPTRGATETSSGLTPAQLSEADQVGKRLVDDFRPLFDTLPQHARSGLGLARYLDIDRGTATRFIGVYSKQITGLDVFSQFPGVKGLSQIVDALAGKGVRKSSLVSAQSALIRFERLITDLGITQTKLAECIVARRSNPEDHERLLVSRRRGLYRAAAESLGHSCDTIVHAHVCRPSPGQEDWMDRAFLQGALGYRARPDAPPLALKTINFDKRIGEPATPDIQREPEFRSLSPSPDGLDAGVTILESFSTTPPPILSPRATGGNGTVIIDAEQVTMQRGIDLVLAQQVLATWRLPKPGPTPTENMHGVRIDAPAKRLVFDIYLHKAMACQYVPRTAIFRMTPAVVTGATPEWYDQLPYPPPLQVISCSPMTQGSRLYARQHEMITAFFDRLQWPIDEFVGYRIEVEYPQYAALYRVIFRSVS